MTPFYTASRSSFRPSGVSGVFLRRVSEEGLVQRVVAYVRVSAKGLQRALAFVEQQNAV